MAENIVENKGNPGYQFNPSVCRLLHIVDFMDP